MDDAAKYGLDPLGTMLIEDFRELMPTLEKLAVVVKDNLEKEIKANKLYINAIECRIKKEKSLAGKIERKNGKYSDILDLTDLVGARVITFYTDEVDKISSLVDKMFEIDWETSVDKRKNHDLSSFGYASLHYICRIPKTLFYDPDFPRLNEIRFEVQMRTALQHVWATVEHDIGYKTDFEVPVEFLRNLNRLAGMLEFADEEFSRIRTNLNDYRHKLLNLVSGGDFDSVDLDAGSFKAFLDLGPFDRITRKIAAINQAEIHDTSCMPYLKILTALGLKTLGDVDRFIKENSEDAYSLAVYQFGCTDLDIVSSTIGIQNICIVGILKRDGGLEELQKMFDSLTGVSSYNKERAKRIYDACAGLPFMNRKK